MDWGVRFRLCFGGGLPFVSRLCPGRRNGLSSSDPHPSLSHCLPLFPVVGSPLPSHQAEHLYYQHESIARAVHKAQAFTNKFGKAEDLHPACTVSSASVPSDGALDVSKGHPAAFLGQPVVDHEHVRMRLEYSVGIVAWPHRGRGQGRGAAGRTHVVVCL